MSIIFLRVEIRGPFVALRKGSRARSRMLWVTESVEMRGSCEWVCVKKVAEGS